MAALPEPQQVIACRDCGEAEHMGFMCFPGESVEPLYVCDRCERSGANMRRCDNCGRFAGRAGIACPMQDWNDLPHRADVQTLYECPVCVERHEELCWFDAADIAGHLNDHVLDGEES